MVLTILDPNYVTFAVAMIGGVVLGGITDWLTKLYVPQLPYTVCLFIEGAIITFSLRISGQFGEENFVEISSFISSVILFLFLPILIFGNNLVIAPEYKI